MLGAGYLWRQRRDRLYQVIAILFGIKALQRISRISSSLLAPPPWNIHREQYNILYQNLSFESGDSIVDLGCGTGRSVVGMASYLPVSYELVGIDVFDSRVILGNRPSVTLWNAKKSNADVSVVTGSIDNLPIRDSSQDIVTTSRVLHDVDAQSAIQAIQEAYRVLDTDGQFGVIELPHTHGSDSDPIEYWATLLENNNFEVQTIHTIPPDTTEDISYIVLIATPRG
ncbi:MAG: class I SAM-dependent methyltransferase [Halobacteriaceae archaeon]